jgi:hypothetical protein
MRRFAVSLAAYTHETPPYVSVPHDLDGATNRAIQDLVRVETPHCTPKRNWRPRGVWQFLENLWITFHGN